MLHRIVEESITYLIDPAEGSASLIHVDIAFSGSVLIPSYIQYADTTYPVTSVGRYAFADCLGITSVQLPSGLRTIQSGAFVHCTSLTTVILPCSLQSIGEHLFDSAIQQVFVAETKLDEYCRMGLDAYRDKLVLDAPSIQDVVAMVQANTVWMELSHSEQLYLDEDMNYVALNQQGQHIYPQCLMQLRRLLVDYSPRYWSEHDTELDTYVRNVFDAVCRRDLDLSPNVVLPPKKEWSNRANKDRLKNILDTDPACTSSFSIWNSINDKALQFSAKSNTRLDMMIRLIRESNPIYWAGREGLLTHIAKSELLKLAPDSQAYLNC